MKNFSPEDLLEYHYKEMSTKKSSELEQALEENWPLKEKMEVIKEAADRLNKSMESPRTEVINSILKYAAAHSKAALKL